MRQISLPYCRTTQMGAGFRMWDIHHYRIILRYQFLTLNSKIYVKIPTYYLQPWSLALPSSIFSLARDFTRHSKQYIEREVIIMVALLPFSRTFRPMLNSLC